MYYKLSLRNVRKSFSDYTLYFLTLTFGVCIFYVFNSIEAQKAMLHISESVLSVMQTITWLMNGVSVFVSCILGFLIVYANNFLIRRRKREFGVYMTLGMRKSKISRLLLTETFLIGVFSLGLGLLAGIFLSQGFSVVTAKLFEVDMTGYTFIFSAEALWKTVLYFGIIFLIAVAANTIAVSKYKLIDLLEASRKNEKQRIKKPAVTWTLAVLAVAMIGTAYAMVLRYGLWAFDAKLVAELILGAVGTFLLFAALSGALIPLLRSREKFYLKGLNMFLVRQLSARVNTAYISMALICLMLFATIGIFSTGIGMTRVLNQGYKDSAPYDISVWQHGDVDLKAELAADGISIAQYTDSPLLYKVYQDQGGTLTYGELLKHVESELSPEIREYVVKQIFPQPLSYLAVSDYNKLLQLQGKRPISLKDNQVALLTQYAWADASLQETLQKDIKQLNQITIGGASYSVLPDLQSVGISNESSELMMLVVPDALIQKGTAAQSFLVFNCKGDTVAQQDSILRIYKNTQHTPYQIISQNEIRAQEGGSKAIISFVGIYVGIVFLITSAAVLALQQVSEAADNKKRYAILKKIGAGPKLLKRTIFKQTAVYFLLPLSVACIHSVVGIKVANDTIRKVGNLNAAMNIIITALLIFVVYGAYFLATYFGSKSIMLGADPTGE